MKVINIFLAISLLVQRESFKVIYVRGDVELERTHAFLKQGDVIFEDDQVRLTPKAFLSLFSEQKGRAYLTDPISAGGQKVAVRSGEQKPLSESKHEFWVSVKSNIIPSVSAHFMAKRGGIASNLTELRNYFSDFSAVKRPVIIPDSMRINLNKTTFLYTGQRFFFIRYIYKGDSINKKLSFIKPSTIDTNLYLLFNRSLYLVDNKPINQEDISDQRLYYYDSGMHLSTFVCTLDLKFVNKQEIIDLLDLLKKHYPAKGGRENMEDLMYAEILQDYGQMDRTVFNKLLKQLP